MIPPVEQAWKHCLDRLSTEIAPQTFKAWFEPIRPISLDSTDSGRQLRLRVPSQFFGEWLEQRYNGILSDIVDSTIGAQTEISFLVDSADFELDTEQLAVATQPAVTDPAVSYRRNPPVRSGRQGMRSPVDTAPHSHQLNPSYTFNTYIEGDCNRLARSAALAIAEAPGATSFNPFFIYGGVGLGKTHLAQAIGNFALLNGWKGRALYVSSERFTTEFVRAIKQNRISDFTTFYRQIDLLIVDDIQFFGGKEKTQEEFFHVFNDLHQSGKQIILSADRPPRDIDGIEERLLSRFQWGLTVDVQPPDLETRIAILQHKAEKKYNVVLHKEVVGFIAERIRTNVRKLEGALLRLAAHANYSNHDADLTSAKEILRDLLDNNQRPLDVENIKEHVADYYKVAIDDLSAKTRRREIVQARQVAMYFCRRFTQHPLKTIGLRFGGRDHSTVIHACKTVGDRTDIDTQFGAEIERLQKDLEMMSASR